MRTPIVSVRAAIQFAPMGNVSLSRCRPQDAPHWFVNVMTTWQLCNPQRASADWVAAWAVSQSTAQPLQASFAELVL